MDKQKNTPAGQKEVRDLFRRLDTQGETAPALEPEEFPPVRSTVRSGVLEEEGAPLVNPMLMEEFDLIDPYDIEDVQEPTEPEVLFFLPEEEELAEFSEGDLPPAPPRRNPFAVMWGGFRENLPARGDTAGTLVRKCAFLLALVVLVVSIGYIVADVLILPMQNEKLYEDLHGVYHPENSEVVEDDEGNYPPGMLASFKELYNRNDEVRGWISYHATGKSDFLKIDYPIMFSGDNDKYLTVDFNEKKNKNGALFFDKNNKLSAATDENKSLIVYGHNMASGQMFAGLNKFIGSVGNARAAAELTLSTLYSNDTYRVFAVMITDEDEVAKWYFNTRRTQFTGDDDFLRYVDQLRARSFFDYPVEVTAEDELLVLSTCTAKSTSKLKDGRLVVVARKVRPGEASLNTAHIQRNTDVIMPRSWYINQGLMLHEYYGGDHAGITTTTGKGTRPTISTITNPTYITTGTGTSASGTTSGTDTTATGSGTASATGSTSATGTTASGTKPTGSTSATKPTASTAPTGDGSSTTPTESTGSADSTTQSTESTEPTETQPTEPSETEPTEPSETEPTEPSETEPTAPSETQPTETTPSEGGEEG